MDYYSLYNFLKGCLISNYARLDYSGLIKYTQIQNIVYLGLLVMAIFGCLSCSESSRDRDWPHYLGGQDRNHFTTLDQITPDNVDQLKMVWEYQTGDSGQMQSNPLIIDGLLFSTTATNEVICLNARNGKLKWHFAASNKKSTMVNRGVAYWAHHRDRRIFTTYNDSLYALDFDTGKRIEDFGIRGAVSLKTGLGEDMETKYVASRTPGTIFEDLIIMPTVVSEGEGGAPGYIQAFDVRTGDVRWVFHTIPRRGEYGFDTWPADAHEKGRIGGANNWAGMAIDPQNEILFVPTGSASPDFYGGDRVGQNLFANSILALNARTGERIWHFQVVHHDIWDRDLPAPPNLVSIHREGRDIPAVAQVTKSGHVYVLHRLTGEPLFPVEEVAVPASTIPGEEAWPTQPIPSLPVPFSRQSITEEEINPYSADRDSLTDLWRHSNKELYTPLSTEPTFILPGSHGGAEWGGAAADREGTLYINSNEMAVVFSLRKTNRQSDVNAELTGLELYQIHCSTCHLPDRRGVPGSDFPPLTDIGNLMDRGTIATIIENGKGRMTGFPQLSDKEKDRIIDFLLDQTDQSSEPAMEMEGDENVEWKFNGYTRFLDRDGMPGISPPWGTLTAIDLSTGIHKWRIPLGDYKMPDGTVLEGAGTPTYGGPLVTENGLLFIASTTDNYFRALDKETGEELWKTRLPFAGFATPSTYMIDGIQYISISCGGGKANAPEGDAIVTFALGD